MVEVMFFFIEKYFNKSNVKPRKIFENQSLLKQLYKFFFQLRKNEKLIEENDKNENDGKVCLRNL